MRKEMLYMSNGNFKILFLMVAILLFSLPVAAEEGKALEITTHELVYANLYRDLKMPTDTSNMTLEYKIKGDNIRGLSFGPAVFIYWDIDLFAGLRLNSSFDSTMRADVNGLRVNDPVGNLGTANEWIEVKLNFTITDMSFYARNLGDAEWVLFYNGERPFTTLLNPPKGVVIGTGWKGSQPYIRNSYTTPGNVGKVYITDIVLKVNGEVLFKEDFQKGIGELKKEYDMEFDSQNKEPVFQVVTVKLP